MVGQGLFERKQVMDFHDIAVHGVNSTMAAEKVLYEDQEIDGHIPVLEVELVPTHGTKHGFGSVTLRIKGKNLADARAEFIPNQVGTLTWTPSGKWVPGKEPDAPV